MFLRSVAKRAEEAGKTIGELLLDLGTARILSTEGGVILSASANGQSYTFAAPAQAGALSHESLAGLISFLIDLYEYVKSQVEGSPTDAQLLAYMLDHEAMQSVGVTDGDYSTLREFAF
jgi:hypothetical protein